MPLYRFTLYGQDPPSDQRTQWFADDVAALQQASRIAAELARHQAAPIPFVMAERVPLRLIARAPSVRHRQ
jgi:hypothetical protein